MRRRSPFPMVHPAAPIWMESSLKFWQIAWAAPQVIARRTARIIAAGPAPGVRDRREFARMGQEKFAAAGESMSAMAGPMLRMNQELARVAMRQWWNVWTAAALATGTPRKRAATVQRAIAREIAAGAADPKVGAALARVVDRGLQPIERRVSANAKRLRRAR
jgi:hypothetical protein